MYPNVYCFAHNYAGTITETLNVTPVVTTNSSVTLSCEIYGYLPRGSQPQITWRMGAMAISPSNPPYSISTNDGSRQIQNGGATPRPSLVSSLTIDVMDESVAGIYLCSGPYFFESIQLDVQEGMLQQSNV